MTFNDFSETFTLKHKCFYAKVEIKLNYQLHFTEYHFPLDTTELIVCLFKFLFLLIYCEREKNLFLKPPTT